MMGERQRGGTRVLSTEMVSLSERLARMLLVRLGCVVVVFSSSLFGIQMAKTGVNLVLLSGLYVFLALSVEALRRWSGNRGLFLIGAMLLMDGIYLAWTTYASGGAHSPLRILLIVHLIAVTLLASYRTGLKVALWHSLLLFVGFYSQLAGFIEKVGTEWAGADVTREFHKMSVYNVSAFWAIALGTALFSALNERELRRRGVDLEALAQMATELDNASDSEGAAERLVNATSETFSFPRAAVILDVGDKISIPAHKGCEALPETMSAKVDWAIDVAWRERTPQVLDWFNPDANPHLAVMFEGARRLVVVPLLAEGNRMGALVAEASHKRRYKLDSRSLEMLEQFALHAALALSNVKLLQQVQKMAETDSLTGVWNRMVFDQVLRKEINRAQRSGTSFALVMLDLDHFKRLNDTYGHQAGDDVLRSLSEALVVNGREFDTVSRYGGEEFALILPDVDVHDAVAITERLRRVIHEVEAPTKVTASFGVAVFPQSGITENELIRAADEALYASKAAGRDCVTAARTVDLFRARSEPNAAVYE
jgi:two-component system, cell cycle response regulator